MTGTFSRGLIAGAAGTAALHAATYLDMAVRGRPASTVPQQLVDAVAGAAGHRVPGRGATRDARRQGLGEVAGIANGLGLGVVFSLVRSAGVRLPFPVGAVVKGAAAMAATDVPVAALGVSDPARGGRARTGSPTPSPHLAYGAVAQAVVAGCRRRSGRCPGRRASAGLVGRSLLLGVAAGGRSSLGRARPMLTARRQRRGAEAGQPRGGRRGALRRQAAGDPGPHQRRGRCPPGWPAARAGPAAGQAAGRQRRRCRCWPGWPAPPPGPSAGWPGGGGPARGCRTCRRRSSRTASPSLLAAGGLPARPASHHPAHPGAAARPDGQRRQAGVAAGQAEGPVEGGGVGGHGHLGSVPAAVPAHLRDRLAPRPGRPPPARPGRRRARRSPGRGPSRAARTRPASSGRRPRRAWAQCHRASRPARRRGRPTRLRRCPASAGHPRPPSPPPARRPGTAPG